MNIICKGCKKEFKRKGRRDLFCCKECYKLSDNRKNSIEKYNRKKGYLPMIFKKCIICRKKFKTNSGKDILICKKCQSLRNYRNYRAKINNCKNSFTDLEWSDLLNKSKGICNKCKKFVGKNNLTQEHKLNLKDNQREYKIEDIECLCKKCNSKKNQYWRK